MASLRGVPCSRSRLHVRVQTGAKSTACTTLILCSYALVVFEHCRSQHCWRELRANSCGLHLFAVQLAAWSNSPTGCGRNSGSSVSAQVGHPPNCPAKAEFPPLTSPSLRTVTGGRTPPSPRNSPSRSRFPSPYWSGQQSRKTPLHKKPPPVCSR
ncbi:hypothetical protein Henu3_gp36 [Mycobacterium phage Henu3 PeY-2017]|nr:hypothetical protein Henu3_gp36 [Mycobacterium phage Henu3 PeY-2017]